MNYAAKVSPLRMSCMWISANPKYLRNRDFDKLQQFSLVAFPLLGKNRLIDNHWCVPIKALETSSFRSDSWQTAVWLSQSPKLPGVDISSEKGFTRSYHGTFYRGNMIYKRALEMFNDRTYSSLYM